jgi:hypothetical protein
MSLNTLSRNLDTLAELGFCSFDASLDVIWVKKMMSYQGKGEKNQRSAAAHLAEDLHHSFLCREFLDAYPDVKQFVNPSFLDTLSVKADTVSATRTPDSRSRSRSRSRFPNRNRKPEQEQDPARRARSIPNASISKNGRAEKSDPVKGLEQSFSLIEAHLRRNIEEISYAAFYEGMRPLKATSHEVFLAVPGPLIQRNENNPALTAKILTPTCDSVNKNFLRGRILRIVNLEELPS